jgi:hypothetical protein
VPNNVSPLLRIILIKESQKKEDQEWGGPLILKWKEDEPEVPARKLQRTTLSGLHFTRRFCNGVVPQRPDTEGARRFDAVRERHATGRWAVAGTKRLDWFYGHSAMQKSYIICLLLICL